jgi:hypothetical protein
MRTKLCVECGEFFSPHHFNEKTCSKLCMTLRRKKEYVPVLRKLKICPICESDFIPNNSNNSKYCSDKCRKFINGLRKKEWQRKNYKPYKTTQEECSVCGIGFLKKRSHQKYCSISCRGKFLKKTMQDTYEMGKIIPSLLDFFEPDERLTVNELCERSGLDKKSVLFSLKRSIRIGSLIETGGSLPYRTSEEVRFYHVHKLFAPVVNGVYEKFVKKVKGGN